MRKWKKVGYFADGIVYASGNKRKLVTPQKPDIYIDLDAKKIWWHPNTRNDGIVESSKGT